MTALKLTQIGYVPQDRNPLTFCADLATVLFILGAITDALDGYLARKWHVESAFGRIMDPVCDKILVIGAFLYLAGPRFVILEKAGAGEAFSMASGVYMWMVVVIIFRELLVTGIRSVVEASGHTFASNWWGKAKMILQTIVVPAVLIIVAHFDPADSENIVFRVIRDFLVWGTVVVTVGSGLPYVIDGAKALRGDTLAR